MSYNKEAAIAAQNAANAAGNIIAALVTSGSIDPSTDVLVSTFIDIQTGVFNSTFALAGTAAFVEAVENAPAPRRNSGGGGGNFKPRVIQGNNGGGGSGQTDPGEVILNTGKYQGRTIADVYEEDSSYIEWMADASKNAFLKRVAGEYLATA